MSDAKDPSDKKSKKAEKKDAPKAAVATGAVQAAAGAVSLSSGGETAPKTKKGGEKQPRHCPLLILGSGPAGWTAAVYAARANLNPV